MTDPGTYPLLTDPDVMRAVEENLGREPAEIALDRRVPHAAVVATQVKYLRRARTKLPAYYAARCILPPRASSRLRARRPQPANPAPGNGRSTSRAASGWTASIWHVVSAASWPSSATPRWRKSPPRISAGWMLATWRWFVPTPKATSRPPASGSTGSSPTPTDATQSGANNCGWRPGSPDVLALGPALERLSGRLCLKNSPLFDVDEAFRLFPRCRVEAVSLGGECKEVVIYADGSGPRITAVALGLGEVSAIPGTPAPPPPERFAAEEYRYLIVPDVALRKARLSRRHLAGRADAWSDNGFGFARERPSGVLGRVLEIARIDPWAAQTPGGASSAAGVWRRCCGTFPFRPHASCGSWAHTRAARSGWRSRKSGTIVGRSG